MACSESINKGKCPGVVYTMSLCSQILWRSSSVGESAISIHGVMVYSEGAAYIQLGSSSCLAGYGNSSSSNCFLLASFYICFIALVKEVRLGAASISCFNMPPCPAPGIIGEPRDMGVLWLDPRPEPGAQEIPLPWVSLGADR